MNEIYSMWFAVFIGADTPFFEPYVPGAAIRCPFVLRGSIYSNYSGKTALIKYSAEINSHFIIPLNNSRERYDNLYHFSTYIQPV